MVYYPSARRTAACLRVSVMTAFAAGVLVIGAPAAARSNAPSTPTAPPPVGNIPAATAVGTARRPVASHATATGSATADTASTRGAAGTASQRPAARVT
ncbi:MAG: hypothetical protein QOI74_2139, partial [Micromonosporaceae bacterium]|nr:hypothetical protein [Micromonosporaceae bacterium]